MNRTALKFSAIVLLCFAAWYLRAGEPAWSTDLAQAQSQAGAEKKNVLLFFHGSDWCPSCKEMQKQVLESPEFVAYARQALVLVDVDFPEKADQSEKLKQANQLLRTKFNVGDNFPTLVLLDDSGQTLFQEAGYAGGGPAEVLPKLQHHVKPPVPAAGSFKNLDVADFAKLVADKQNVILDVRTAREFQAGHMPAAINLDVSSPDFESQAARLDKNKTYLVHCATGVRSVRACKKLGQLKFPSLYNLTGGFRAWAKAGQPVEK